MKNKEQPTKSVLNPYQKASEQAEVDYMQEERLIQKAIQEEIKERRIKEVDKAATNAICDSVEKIKQIMLFDDWASNRALTESKKYLENLAIGTAYGGRAVEVKEYRVKAIEHIDRLIKEREEEERLAAIEKAAAQAELIRQEEERLIQGAIQTEIEEQSTEELAKKQAWEKREEEKKTEFLRRVAEEAKKPTSKLEQANNTLSERLVREDTERLQSPSVRTFTCTEGTFENNAHLFAEAIIKRNNNRLDTAIELQPPGDEIDTAHACMNQWMKKI